MTASESNDAAPHKRCLGCGYILNGLPENRCPECGQEFEPRDPATYRVGRPALQRRQRGPAVLGCAGLGLYAGLLVVLGVIGANAKSTFWMDTQLAFVIAGPLWIVAVTGWALRRSGLPSVRMAWPSLLAAAFLLLFWFVLLTGYLGARGDINAVRSYLRSSSGG